MRTGFAWLTLVAALVVTTGGFAHEGHHHSQMGTIASVAEAEITLTTTDGKTETFATTDKTTYERGDVPVARSTLVTGERAAVMYEVKEDVKIAIQLKLQTGSS